MEPAHAAVPKRGETPEQVALLGVALAGVIIDPALPYTPQVLRALKAAILATRLLPGTPLSEAAIASVLGMSRTPVREALKELSTENLLDIFPQAGTVVSPIRMALIEQGCFVRDALEGANLLDVMHTLKAPGRKRIRTTLAAQAQALAAGDADAFFMHDEAMHRLFFELTDRLPVWTLVNQAKQHVDRARLLLIHDDLWISQRAYDEHRVLVRALFDADETGLRAALNGHVMSVADAVLEYSRSHANEFVR